MLEFDSINNDCNCNPNSLESFQESSCNTPEVINWNSIINKPSCFVPCAHTHTPNQIIGLDTYIQGIQFATGANSTNSIQASLLSGILSFNLKLSANSGTGYKVPLSILSDGLIGQIPFASGTNSGILTNTDWINFSNKFNTPTGTISQYIRGDGSLGNFPTSTFGPAGGDLSGTYPNPTVLWSNGYTNYDTRYYRVTNPNNYISFASIISGFSPVNSAIVNGDTIVQAFSKAQGQINSKWTRPIFTTGSVLFWSGSDVAQNNGEFFWDNVNNRLGIGTLTPSTKLHIFGPASSGLTALIECFNGFQKIGYRVSTASAIGMFGQFNASEFGFGSESNSNFLIFTDNTKLLAFRNSTAGGINDPHVRFDRTNFTFSDFGLGGTTDVTGIIQRNNEGFEFIGAQIFSSTFTIPTSTSGTVFIPKNIAVVDITNGRANNDNLSLNLSNITRNGTEIIIRMGGVTGGTNYSVTLVGVTTSPINGYSLSTNASIGRTLTIKLINNLWQLISIF